MKTRLLIILFLIFASPAISETNETFEIAADEIIHEQDGNKIIAKGNIEIHYTNYILKADELVYFADTERVSANNNVEITYKDGSKINADNIDITQNLYDIAGKNFKLMFPNGTHFTAEKVKKENNGALRLKNASYSSCKVCYDEDGNQKPLVWEANANNITYDKENKEITYKSLWLEMFDIPVFYLPYFYHPDPDVERKTGFLFPSFGSETNIGEYIETPFYIDISDYSDLTITPTIATQHNPILSAHYRHNFTNGMLDIEGMMTDNDESGFRGHIDFLANFNINDNWKTTIDFERVSDDTVLKYYDLIDTERAWIQSKASLERFDRNSNLSFNLLSFQDLRADVDDKRIPDIIPYFEYNKTVNGLPYGSYLKFHTNLLDMERNSDYQSTRRIATTIEYTKPYVSPIGAVFNFSAFAATNFYSISDYEYEQGETFSGSKMFFIPNLMLEAKYPLAKKQENSYQVVEPIVQFIAAPNSSISNKIPNEDSQDFEFEDSNVFQQNHFGGYDRYDIGSRINYGLNWTIYGNQTGKTSLFLGQSFRFNDTYKYPENSGFTSYVSDIVGSMTINPSPELFADIRFRLDSENLAIKQNEITIAAGPPIFRLNLDYLYLTSTTTEYNDLDDREEINMSLNSRFAKQWNAGVFFQRDLKENRNIEFGGNIYYDDECLQTGVEITRSYTHDRDYSDGLSVKFNIIFKSISDANKLYDFEGFDD